MLKSRTRTANSAIIGIYTLLVFTFTIAVFYFAQIILKPIATALLLTFLLTPLASKVERWVGRIFSIIIVVCLLLISSGIVTYIFSRQVVDFTSQLPSYRANIETKLDHWQASHNEFTTRILQMMNGIQTETPSNKNETQGVSATHSFDKTQQVMKEKVIEEVWGLLGFIPAVFGSIFHFLATSLLVLILVFFMLFKREELHDKSIHLFNKNRIGVAVLAIDEAGNKVLHYLLRLLIVNFSYGALVMITLYFIGIPNAALWGGISFVFRFMPYIGAWLAAIIPILLSILLSNNWLMPLETISMFLILEIIIGNFVEPIVYGKGVGVSSLALIIAAIFWTWLWGTIGLVLAIPLTVCIVVLGRHIQRLEFLSILMSDEQPLQLYQQCYSRLFTGDINEATHLMNNYLKDHSLASLYDEVLIPVIIEIENAFRNEDIDVEQREYLYQNIRDILEEIEIATGVNISPKISRALCLPLRYERDELTTQMLVQLLEKRNIHAESLPLKNIIDRDVKDLMKTHSIIIISVAPMSSLLHARYMSIKLKQKNPDVKIIVGLWGYKNLSQKMMSKLHSAGIDEVILSFEEAEHLLNND